MAAGIALTACGDDDSANKNNPPAIDDLTFPINEDVPIGTVVGSVEAKDEEQEALRFAITEGNTDKAFTINAERRQLLTNKNLDFETTPNYTLTITVSDGELSATADITINVTDVNEAPTIAPDQSFSVPEDAMNGTAVGTVQDADMDNLMFTITSGNTGDVFAIVEGTEAITVAGSLDFENTQSYTLKVSVSDGNLSATADITVNVTNVNDNALTITAQTFSVPEDANNGTAVGTVQASDAETNNLMFSIASGNTGNVFAIGEGTGAITVAGTLDFENTQSYTLKVRVSDGNLSATADITINVTNVNDNAPTITDQTFTVAEDAMNGTAVGTVQASDAETNNLMFSITQGNTGNVFALDASTGALSTMGALDFEITQSYTLKISVSDGSLSATADITVNVTDVDETAATRKEIADLISALETKQNPLVQPITAIETQVNALTTGTPTPENIQGAKDAITARKVTPAEIRKLQADIGVIMQKITALETAGNAPSGTIQPLKDDLEARKRAQTQITTIQQKLTALETEIDGVEEKIAIEGLISALEMKQNVYVQQSLNDAMTKLNALKMENPKTDAAYQATKSAIDAITVPAVQKITELQNELDAINQKITALENAGNAPSGMITILKASLGERTMAQQTIVDIAAAHSTLNTELRKNTPPADFMVSSTNSTINIDGLANVYTVFVDTDLTNWTITSSDYNIIPDQYIQKMGDTRFQMVVGGYTASADRTSRNIVLTLSSGSGSDNLVLTVTQMKNAVDFSSYSPDPASLSQKGVVTFNTISIVKNVLLSTDTSEVLATIGVFKFNVESVAHNYSASVRPANRIRLPTPITNAVALRPIILTLTPPDAGNTDYAIITITSVTDPTKKANIVIVLRLSSRP
ncbi:MAG: cadherin domain-containing protein [Ekhidna sp.]|nr:cadherin domain-containing protein [Ekhidna sp.]